MVDEDKEWKLQRMDALIDAFWDAKLNLDKAPQTVKALVEVATAARDLAADFSFDPQAKKTWSYVENTHIYEHLMRLRAAFCALNETQVKE